MVETEFAHPEATLRIGSRFLRDMSSLQSVINVTQIVCFCLQKDNKISGGILQGLSVAGRGRQERRMPSKQPLVGHTTYSLTI